MFSHVKAIPKPRGLSFQSTILPDNIPCPIGIRTHLDKYVKGKTNKTRYMYNAEAILCIVSFQLEIECLDEGCISMDMI